MINTKWSIFREKRASAPCNIMCYCSISISFQLNMLVYSNNIRRSESDGLSKISNHKSLVQRPNLSITKSRPLFFYSSFLTFVLLVIHYQTSLMSNHITAQQVEISVHISPDCFRCTHSSDDILKWWLDHMLFFDYLDIFTCCFWLFIIR